jgi:osmotically-inducible protein OsmY
MTIHRTSERAVLNRHTQLPALTLTFIVSVVLYGCAIYRKCGFEGCPGDAAITAEIETLFKQHPALEPPNLLNVRTLDHVVYLYGLVDTDFERQMAESVALQAPGVATVVNSIGISGNF